MTDKPNTTRIRLPDAPSWTTAIVLAVSMLAGGGGLGSGITGVAVSQEVATLRTQVALQGSELKHVLSGLGEKMDASGSKLERVEERLRLVEVSQQQIKDLMRRVEALEQGRRQ